MKLLRVSLLVLAVLAIFFSCKNEVKSEGPEGSATSVKKEKTELPQKEKDRVNSVLTKMMVTPELKTFTSATVTAGITEMLQKDSGPYTIIAPSNAAFDQLSKEQLRNLLDPANKEALNTLLKNHIIEDNLDSASLTKSLRSGDQTLKTLGGAELTLSKDGTDMILKDEQGNRAVIGKSDILGSNGIVHVISAVLTTK